MTFPDPPRSILDLDLPRNIHTLQGFADTRPPTGPMQPFLGRRYATQEIDIPERADAEDRFQDRLKLVRAFEVTPLIGAGFHARRNWDLNTSLYNLLAELLPGIPWELEKSNSRHLGRLYKYFIFHDSIAAPVDQTTDEAMALEIYGQVVRIDEYDAGSPEGEARKTAMQDAYYSLWKDDIPAAPPWDIEGSFDIEIQAATYANVCFPGAGVPFYI